ncbi:hypothetical protein MAR_027379 [Mya arenaria]|uniref:Uncharacterized protein n=1 Tax=Mya arenaria TaxID=6604 RepID=A0ABY7EVS1_MYAAR|nr:hypothetical protein MAR_027379 [Mya arenaria]
MVLALLVTMEMVLLLIALLPGLAIAGAPHYPIFGPGVGGVVPPYQHLQEYNDFGSMKAFVGKRYMDIPMNSMPGPVYQGINALPWTQFKGQMQNFPMYHNFIPNQPPMFHGGAGFPPNGNFGHQFCDTRVPWQIAHQAYWGTPNTEQFGENMGANQVAFPQGYYDDQGGWKPLPVDNPLEHIMSPNSGAQGQVAVNGAPYYDNNINWMPNRATSGVFGPNTGPEIQFGEQKKDDVKPNDNTNNKDNIVSMVQDGVQTPPNRQLRRKRSVAARVRSILLRDASGH